MYTILNKTGKKPNGVPFHMINVGLRSIHIGSFHILSALLMTISTMPFRILYLCYLKTPSENNMLEQEF